MNNIIIDLSPTFVCLSKATCITDPFKWSGIIVQKYTVARYLLYTCRIDTLNITIRNSVL